MKDCEGRFPVRARSSWSEPRESARKEEHRMSDETTRPEDEVEAHGPLAEGPFAEGPLAEGPLAE